MTYKKIYYSRKRLPHEKEALIPIDYPQSWSISCIVIDDNNPHSFNFHYSAPFSLSAYGVNSAYDYLCEHIVSNKDGITFYDLSRILYFENPYYTFQPKSEFGTLYISEKYKNSNILPTAEIDLYPNAADYKYFAATLAKEFSPSLVAGLNITHINLATHLDNYLAEYHENISKNLRSNQNYSAEAKQTTPELNAKIEKSETGISSEKIASNTAILQDSLIQTVDNNKIETSTTKNNQNNMIALEQSKTPSQIVESQDTSSLPIPDNYITQNSIPKQNPPINKEILNQNIDNNQISPNLDKETKKNFLAQETLKSQTQLIKDEDVCSLAATTQVTSEPNLFLLQYNIPKPTINYALEDSSKPELKTKPKSNIGFEYIYKAMDYLPNKATIKGCTYNTIEYILGYINVPTKNLFGAINAQINLKLRINPNTEIKPINNNNLSSSKIKHHSKKEKHKIKKDDYSHRNGQQNKIVALTFTAYNRTLEKTKELVRDDKTIILSLFLSLNWLMFRASEYNQLIDSQELLNDSRSRLMPKAIQAYLFFLTTNFLCLYFSLSKENIFLKTKHKKLKNKL